MATTVTAPRLKVHALSRSYGDFRAVKDISFTVDSGEVVGLVGPNGAGKTTTLRCLTGIIRPTRGRITVAGHDMAESPERAKSALAFMPDEPALFDSITVTEHLRVVARLFGVSNPNPTIERLLAEFDLTAKRDAFPDALSRGMKQKLVIACGLVHEPDVLIFDEPLTGLDPGSISRMKTTILDRARDGAAVVLSSHLLHLVEELCTRVLVIAEGRFVAEGTLDEIAASQPEFAGLGIEELFMALTGPAA